MDSWKRDRDLEMQLRRLQGRWHRLMTTLPGLDAETGFYNENRIKGLCPKQCSCDQCRAARRSDPDYQNYLAQKSSLEAIRSMGATYSHLHSSASLVGGNVVGIMEAWIAEYQKRLDAHCEKFNGHLQS